MSTIICRGIFDNFRIANMVKISAFFYAKNYNMMTMPTMNIAMGNNEELVNCQLLQVSKFYIV